MDIIYPIPNIISNYTYNRKEKEKIENDDEKTKIENTPWNRYENRRPSLSKREMNSERKLRNPLDTQLVSNSN